MTTSMLLTRLPHGDEDAERILGLSARASAGGKGAHLYLLGDGVLCAMKGQKTRAGELFRKAVSAGLLARASAKDCRARGITTDSVESGVEIIEDFEGAFIEDMMEHSGGVISW